MTHLTSPWVSFVSGPAMPRALLSWRPASPMIERVTNSRVPSLCGHYSASSLLRTHPSPSHLRPPSRCFRLYGLHCSGNFSPGWGGLLQLLSAPLSPCRRYHPAGGIQRFSSCALNPAVFASDPEARPPELLFRGYLTFAFATAWWLTTILLMALSVGFRVSVSLPPATRVTGLRLLPRWDCLPLSVPAFPGRTGLLSVHSRYNLRTRQVAQSDLLHQRPRRLRYLHRRSGYYRVERSSSRAGLFPAVDQRLFTAHRNIAITFIIPSARA